MQWNTRASERTSFFVCRKSTWILFCNDLEAIKDGAKLWPWTNENHSFCCFSFLFTRARENWSIVYTWNARICVTRNHWFLFLLLCFSVLSNAAPAPFVNNFALNDVRIQNSANGIRRAFHPQAKLYFHKVIIVSFIATAALTARSQVAKNFCDNTPLVPTACTRWPSFHFMLLLMTPCNINSQTCVHKHESETGSLR